MPEMTARILLVEDNKTDALLLQHSLAEVTAADVALTWVECIGDGLAALRKNTFDIVLLDLTLADSSGPDTYARIQKTAPHLPIVVLTGSLDEAAGVEAIRRGVQDYLVKGVSGGDIVTRSIRYAIERKRLEESLKNSHAELELRVQERTAELRVANEMLTRELNDRIIAEEKAKILELGLLHAEKMKSLGIMVAGLAHEINNPNQFIATSISFLRDAWMSIEPIINEYLLANDDFLVAGVSYSGNASSIRELFDKTAQSTWKIKMIVDSLLGYSRKGSTLLTDTVDVNQAIDNALTLVGGSLKKKSAGIVMERDGHLPAIRGNRQQIEQVLVNLFTNACQALTGTGQRIFLNTGRDASGNIQITVRDEGCGMSDDELKNIMTPFFTTKRDSGGVGLGLFICSNIVKDHKGTIVFSTKQGEGTTVQVSFPPAV